jgi:hypothetical protein
MMIPVSTAVSIVLLQNLGTNLAPIWPDVITPCLDNGYDNSPKCETVPVGRKSETFPSGAVHQFGDGTLFHDDLLASAFRHCMPQWGVRESGRDNE